MKLIIIASLFLLHTSLSQAAVDKDEVKSLYGLSWRPSFKHYSGYLPAGDNKFLHYWFVQSQGALTDPLLLWLNGGPGCSSMDGFLSEHGPFLISPDGHNLTKNPYSWNLLANVLYIESPVGVGYSYATDNNYTTSDDVVSLQNFHALKSFFSLYPEFKLNDFYAMGESYGGIYIPTLSVRLAEDSEINFKGFAIGNGLTNYNYNLNSMVYFAYHHGLIGEKLWLEAVSRCCVNANSTLGNCDFAQEVCEKYTKKIFDVIDSLNIYNLYSKCYYNVNNNINNNNNNNNINNNKENIKNNKSIKEIKKSNREFVENRYFGYVNDQLKRKVSVEVPCIDSRAMTNYLNLKQVRKDLHIVASIGEWSICTDLQYERKYDNVKPQFIKLLSDGKYRALVYNGDTDMACNFLGDQWFVESLGFETTHERTEWFYIDPQDNTKQIGGFYKRFRNITVITIKGAGHMVPQDKPLQSIYMLKMFLSRSI